MNGLEKPALQMRECKNRFFTTTRIRIADGCSTILCHCLVLFSITGLPKVFPLSLLALNTGIKVPVWLAI